MVDPPDLGGYYLQLHPAGCLFVTDGDQANHRIDTIHPSLSSLRTRDRHRHLSRLFSSTSLLLLLCAFAALLLPQASGHALPIKQHEDSLRASSPTSLQSHGLAANKAVDKDAVITWPETWGHYTLPLEPTKADTSFTWYKRQASGAPAPASCARDELPTGRKIGFAFLVVILVLLSGVFAGLTLGYMSLDETQLQVLMTTGNDVQRARAAKILPIRKDGHLLLTTLLIANMITNETLPIIFDPLLTNQVLSVVISTVLIVIFAELIPQSTCSRYGLQIGAYMAFPTRIIIFVLWPVAYPVSRILHWVLGPHHGIVYRRAELKELVTMHAVSGGRGGDLKGDTVMIVGGALDLQEKVVRQAMTPMDQVFMLPFTAKLDYPTLEKIVRSGHSRIPIYQEVEVQVGTAKSGANTPKKKHPLFGPFSRKTSSGPFEDTIPAKSGSPRLDGKEQTAPNEGEGTKTVIRNKIVGTLLVKSCVLLDPEDAVPVSSMVINALPTVPADEPLLSILNAFQEGRSHMAIVSSRSRRAVPDNVIDLGSKSNLYSSSQGPPLAPAASAAPRVDGLGHIDEEKNLEGTNTDFTRSNSDDHSSLDNVSSSKTRREDSPKRRSIWGRAFRKLDGGESLEQTVPADATISEKKAASGFQELRKWESQHSQSAAHFNDESELPLGIITLEDVLEELLGEEILDEYDDRGNEEQDFRTLMPPPSPENALSASGHTGSSHPIKGAREDATTGDIPVVSLESGASITSPHSHPTTQATLAPPKKTVLNRLGLTRQRSQRDSPVPMSTASILTDEPDSMEQSKEWTPDEVMMASPSPAIAAPSGEYFGEANKDERTRPLRSSSVPPADRQHKEGENRARSVSRPATPTGAATIASPLASPALCAPQPYRAVVIRTQVPGGASTTTIANESLLRGRQHSLPAQSTVAMGLNLSSRSQTPAAGGGGASALAGGNKTNRFKSQAAVGVGGSGTSTSATTRSRSQAPAPAVDLSSSIGTLNDDDEMADN